jgi:Fe-S cluster biosynthesis and repair protein YggX
MNYIGCATNFNIQSKFTVPGCAGSHAPTNLKAKTRLEGEESTMGCGGGMGPPPVEIEQAGGRKVFCVKFQREMPGLDETPFDNHPLGQRIYENVSKEAWRLWLEHMKMIMNEYRLNLGTPEAQEFLLKQMEDYFFGEGAAFPPGYVPQRAKA